MYSTLLTIVHSNFDYLPPYRQCHEAVIPLLAIDRISNGALNDISLMFKLGPFFVHQNLNKTRAFSCLL